MAVFAVASPFFFTKLVPTVAWHNVGLTTVRRAGLAHRQDRVAALNASSDKYSQIRQGEWGPGLTRMVSQVTNVVWRLFSMLVLGRVKGIVKVTIKWIQKE